MVTDVFAADSAPRNAALEGDESRCASLGCRPRRAGGARGSHTPGPGGGAVERWGIVGAAVDREWTIGRECGCSSAAARVGSDGVADAVARVLLARAGSVTDAAFFVAGFACEDEASSVREGAVSAVGDVEAFVDLGDQPEDDDEDFDGEDEDVEAGFGEVTWA